MQRFVLCLLVLILAAAPVWAARNPIQPINKSPYVSALVIDADTGNVLFEDNADARVYPASVLKLMDLYVLLDRIDQGLLKLDEMVPVTAEAYKTGGSQVYLDPKEQFTVEELLYGLMLCSGNDAATALACYLAASRRLPLGLFGLLGYLEPALLFGVSLLLGERMAPGAAWTYVPIWLALGVLAVDGLQQWRRLGKQPV